MTDITGIAGLIIKILALLGFGIYFIYAAVIVRQERLMSAVIDEGFEPVIKGLVLIHLAASLGIIILALLVL